MSTKSTQKSPAAFEQKLQEVFGSHFYHSRPVAEYTYSKLGGTADYLVEAQTIAELMSAAQIGYEQGCPVTVIGAGSGVLFSGVGFPGLVIVNKTSRLLLEADKSQVVADSGVANDVLLNWAAGLGLGSLEFLTAIPGTIGGAVASGASYQNQSILAAVKEMSVFVPGKNGGQTVTITAAELKSQPLHPLFAQPFLRSTVILMIRLQLAKIAQPEILRRLFKGRQTAKNRLGQRRLGYIFTISLANQPDTVEFRQALKSRVVKLCRDDQDILQITRNDATPAARQFIQQLSRCNSEAGPALELRLQFLGYWPDDESN